MTSVPRRFEIFAIPTRFRRAGLCIGLAILAALPIIYLYVTTSPLAADVQDGGATIHFETDRARWMFPGQCVVLSWAVDGIREIYVNKKGHVGTDSKMTCDSDTIPNMRVLFQDGRERTFRLPVEIMYRNPIIAGLWIAIIVLVACAAYQFFGISGSLFTITLFLFWSITQIWVEIGVDWAAHLRFQQLVQEKGNLNLLPPHFLYHVLGLGLAGLFPGTSLQRADFVVVLVAYAFGSVALYQLLKAMIGEVGGSKIRQALIYIPLTLSVWCVTPLEFSLRVLQNWLTTPYITMNMFNVPTLILLKPFAVMIFAGLVKWGIEPGKRPWLPIAVVGLATIGATLSKPNYTMAIVPAGILVLGIHFLKPFPLNRRLIIAGVLIPAIAVLAWQYLYVYGPNAASEVYNADGGASIAFSPLELYLVHWNFPIPELAVAFVLSSLFPIVVYLAYFRAARRSFPLNLAWLVFLIGQSFAYIFIEIGYQGSGNLTWGGRITLFVLFAASLGFLVRQNAETFFTARRLPRDPRLYLCVGVYLLHLLPYLQYASVKPTW